MTSLLQAVAPGLWAAHDLLKTAGVHFPLRMVVVDTGDGLWLHSPIDPTPELVDEVRALGEVRWLVSGSRYHHLFLAPWQERCPDAAVWRVDDLRREQPPWAGVEHVPLEGAPRLDEVAFFHPASRSLIVSDLLFNIRDSQSALTRLTLKLVRAFGRPAQSRFFRFSTKDKAAMRASLERVLAWDFDRVLMCHGEIIETGGHAVVEEVCAWALRR